MSEQDGNNKILAEFMGVEIRAYKGNGSFDKKFKTYANCEEWIKKQKLKGYQPQLGWKNVSGDYHKSWSSLMPVFEKINSLKDDKGAVLYQIEISPTGCSLKWKGEDFLAANRWPTLIESVYRVVVELINFHNEQKDG